MSEVELRAEINALMDRVDESFLKVVYSMLDTYVQEQGSNPIVSYDIDGTPRTAMELTALLDEEVEAAKKGEYVTLQDFKKQSSTWGQSTK